MGVKINKNTRIEFGARYNHFFMKDPDDLIENKINALLKANSGNFSSSLLVNSFDEISQFQAIILNIGMSFGF